MNLNRIIWAVAFAITMPTVLTFVFTAIRNAKSNPRGGITDQEFVVKYPRIIAWIGFVGNAILVAVGIILTLYWSGKANTTSFVLFYVVFGLFILLGTYLVLKCLIFRIDVSGEQIKAHNLFRRPHTFSFNDIDSAEVQIKVSNINPERIIIRTTSGKKIIAESMAKSYDRIVKRVKEEVPSERLKGYF